MENLLLWIGRLAGVLGILVCAVAFGARLTGMWNLGGFQVGALLQSGMAAPPAPPCKPRPWQVEQPWR